MSSECVDEGSAWVTDPTVPGRVWIGKVEGFSAGILWIVASHVLNLWCGSSQPWYGNEDESQDLRDKCSSGGSKTEGRPKMPGHRQLWELWGGDGWQCWVCEQRGCHCSLRTFCCPPTALGHRDSLAKPFLCPLQPPGLNWGGRRGRSKEKSKGIQTL